MNFGTKKTGELTKDAGILILCETERGTWFKVESPSFTSIVSAKKWLNRQLEYGELAEEDDYFLANKICCEEFKKFFIQRKVHE